MNLARALSGKRVECQLQSLKSIATRVEEFKLQNEQEKIAKGEKLDDVSQWSLTIEAEQTSADEKAKVVNRIQAKRKPFRKGGTTSPSRAIKEKISLSLNVHNWR